MMLGMRLQIYLQEEGKETAKIAAQHDEPLVKIPDDWDKEKLDALVAWWKTTIVAGAQLNTIHQTKKLRLEG